MAGKLCSAIAPLVLVPLTLSYLGQERYGAWMAVLSLTSMALFADLGMGNSLLTKLPEALAKGDHREAVRYITSAYVIVCSVAAGIIVLTILLSASIDWASLFNATDMSVMGDLSAIFLASSCAFALNMPLSLVQRIQYARGQAVISNVWQVVITVVVIGATVAGVATRLSPIMVIVVFSAATPLGNLLNTCVHFWTTPQLRPSLSAFDWNASQSLFKLGARFLSLSVATAVSLNVDPVLVARLQDASAAAVYAIASRLFSVLGLVVTFGSLPLWAANGEAIANGDVKWVRRVASRASILLAALVAVLGAALSAWGDEVLERMVHLDGEYWTSPLFPLLLAVWYVMLAALAPFFMVQNSSGVLGPQLSGWILYLVVSIPCKIAALHRFGLPGIPGAACVAYLMTVVPSAIVGYKKSLRHAAKKETVVADSVAR